MTKIQLIVVAALLIAIATALTPKQEALIGHWNVESQEGLDDFLKAVGIGWILRTAAKVQKPSVEIKQEEPNQWHLWIKSAFKNIDWKMPLSQKVTAKTIDGRVFYITTTLDSNGHLKSVESAHPDEPDNIPSVIDRYVNQEGKLVITETAPTGEVSTRVFTRAT